MHACVVQRIGGDAMSQNPEKLALEYTWGIRYSMRA